MGDQRRAPAALPPGKTWYPLYRSLGGPQAWSEQVQKISPPPGSDPRTFNPVASRYTNCAIPAHGTVQFGGKTFFSSPKLADRIWKPPLTWARDFSLLQIIQTSPLIHTASPEWELWAIYHNIKQPPCEVEVKNANSNSFILSYAFISCKGTILSSPTSYIILIVNFSYQYFYSNVKIINILFSCQLCFKNSCSFTSDANKSCEPLRQLKFWRF